MGILLLAMRLLLAGVFGVAGTAKLADLAGTRQAVSGFGIPGFLATPVGIMLPVVELSITVALLFSSLAWWGAGSALGMLLLFIIAIVVNLAQGRKPDCHCFGQLQSAPIGWNTLVRNVLLAAMSGFIIWQGPDVTSQSTFFRLSTTEIIGLIGIIAVLSMVTIEGWFLLHLIQQNGRLLLRIEALEGNSSMGGAQSKLHQAQSPVGLTIGTRAPGFQLFDLSGEQHKLEDLHSGNKPVILIFSDPNCGPCNALLPEVAAWERGFNNLIVTLVSRGSIEANRVKAAQYGLKRVLLQSDREVAEAYQARGTPSAILIRPTDVVGSQIAQGAQEIRELISEVVGIPISQAVLSTTPSAKASVHATSSKVGARAPAIRLPDLSGKVVDLENFRHSELLILFWNPNCGFCAKMLKDLKAWEANPPNHAPKLLMVSRGTLDANQTMGLQSPILLDQDFRVGREYGASGTPAAVLVDARGMIASDVAVGISGVLALAGVASQ